MYKYTFVVSNFKTNKMKITVTGSLGNISKRLTEQLLQKGHEVTVISHSPEKVQPIEALGAKPAIGSLSDIDFLVESFSGADAVYLMTPPSYDTSDLKGSMAAIADNYIKAINRTRVKHVASLSGIGAQSPTGNGPSSAFHYIENRLNELVDVNVLHLRPGMFYTNYHGSIGMIKRLKMTGNNFDADKVIVMSHPHDIADAAADALDTLSFSGKKIQYIASDELTGAEIARILGNAFDIPNLPWVVYTDEQLIGGIMQGGFSQHMAENFAEMGRAISKGDIWEPYYADKANAYGKLKFKDFAAELAIIYKD